MSSWDIENHLRLFPHASMHEHEGRLWGHWMIGNNYKRKHGYHGEYPPSYIERVKSLFPGGRNCLHVFSGSVDCEEDATFDINPDSGADWVGNAEEIGDILGLSRIQMIMADPPYTTNDAKIYGYKMPRKNIVMQQLRKIIARDGVLVWLDTRRPMYRKVEWRLSGIIGLDCGTNRIYRGVFIFEPEGGKAD